MGFDDVGLVDSWDDYADRDNHPMSLVPKYRSP